MTDNEFSLCVRAGLEALSYWGFTGKWQDLILGQYNGSFEFDSRQEATESAFKKADEIYNLRK